MNSRRQNILDVLGQPDGTISNIKLFLEKKLNLKLEVTTDAENNNQYHICAYKIDQNDEKLKAELAKFADNIAYRFETRIDGLMLSITELDPRILLGHEEALTQAAQEVITQAVANETTTQLCDTKTELAPLNFSACEPNSVLTLNNLANFDSLCRIIQTTENLENIMLNNISLRQFVLNNFNQYKALAEIFIFEYICRGNLNELKTFMNIQCTGEVKKIAHIKYQLMQFGSYIQEQYRDQIENYSYLVKANFDFTAFAKYIMQKKKLSSGKTFLGLKEDVEECIKFASGDPENRSSKTQALLQYLAKLDCYTSLESLFQLQPGW